MKKGQIVEGIVTKVDFPNKGIVKVEGQSLATHHDAECRHAR